MPTLGLHPHSFLWTEPPPLRPHLQTRGELQKVPGKTAERRNFLKSTRRPWLGRRIGGGRGPCGADFGAPAGAGCALLEARSPRALTQQVQPQRQAWGPGIGTWPRSVCTGASWPWGQVLGVLFQPGSVPALPGGGGGSTGSAGRSLSCWAAVSAWGGRGLVAAPTPAAAGTLPVCTDGQWVPAIAAVPQVWKPGRGCDSRRQVVRLTDPRHWGPRWPAASSPW